MLTSLGSWNELRNYEIMKFWHEIMKFHEIWHELWHEIMAEL